VNVCLGGGVRLPGTFVGSSPACIFTHQNCAGSMTGSGHIRPGASSDVYVADWPSTASVLQWVEKNALSVKKGRHFLPAAPLQATLFDKSRRKAPKTIVMLKRIHFDDQSNECEAPVSHCRGLEQNPTTKRPGKVQISSSARSPGFISGDFIFVDHGAGPIQYSVHGHLGRTRHFVGRKAGRTSQARLEQYQPPLPIACR